MWGNGWGHHSTTHMDGSGWLWMISHSGIFVLLMVAVLVVGFFIANRHFSSRGRENVALTALGTRYAAGEIDQEEYLKKKIDLKR